LEVLDFDHPNAFQIWARRISVLGLGDLLHALPLIKTPSEGRYHLYYRTHNPKSGKDLARLADKTLLIEWRGEGNAVRAVGSPAYIHPTGRLYRLVWGSLWDIPVITDSQREVFWQVAREQNRYVKNPPRNLIRESHPSRTRGKRYTLPSTLFNQEATWEGILEPKGWRVVRTSGSILYWQKPNDTGDEHHATTGFGEADTFHCFSTNASPFEEGEDYTKFAAYALLYCEGDFHKAAQRIRINRKEDHESYT
jgi:hypothetical protein